METTYTKRIADELKVRPQQVAATVDLLDADATVPFISRYRKEVTGSLDEVAITVIRDRIAQLRDLDKRRQAILKSLDERELLTDDLRAEIVAADSMAVLEDIYLPFKPKRRTRASIARERGLEPLAEILLEQDDTNPQTAALEYCEAESEVVSVEDALAGARDIIAEWINEDADIRASLRTIFTERGEIQSQVISGKQATGAKFSDYFDWAEPIAKSPSHRVLAMRRGEAEGVLRLRIMPDENEALGILEDAYVINDTASAEQVGLAAQDCYKRLLGPAMETETRLESKTRADIEAIRVFSQNLRELLMASPLGRKSVLALDPGFRTGCKLVCLDRQGKLVHHSTVYPHTGEQKRQQAGVDIKALCQQYDIKVIAIGNGTAGRETESFVQSLAIKSNPIIEMVNESGASIYSASEAARNEFPDHDITVRGAVSIGRRLMDPLAELVKIDAKSIGVGQYQHDVDQTALRQGLDDTVLSCVNGVGVELNTASCELLTYVSGLGPNLAQNIVDHRNDNGPFKSRKALKKVARLGPKAFEQAAGFLRLADAANPLDRSAVHPESYAIVEQMASSLGCTVGQLMLEESLRQKISLNDFVTDKVGMPTLLDIMEELAKPGRDPRAQYESFSFDQSVNAIGDLKAGMQLPGIITNVTAFGAFVDIGVHQDGLVHISEIADRFIKDPAEIVKVQQRVSVHVLEIDIDRKRISLSLRKQPD